jgi:triphosphatase
MTGPDQRPTEVEAKFTATGPALLQELAKRKTTVEGYRFGEAVTTEVKDVYLDAPDYRLLRNGLQLRLRVVDGVWQVALKARGVGSDVGIFRRLEIEEPLVGTDRPAEVKDLPESIRDALSGFVGKHRALGIICSLDQTRAVREVTSASPGRKAAAPSHLARLSLDEMRIRQGEGEAILARAYEVEIELAAGVDVAELQVLADRFMGSYGLVPSTDSKLERALGIISRHPVDLPENWLGIAPNMHMGEACRIIWHEQFMKMLMTEAGIRYSPDPEYVHNARVAIRRMRAAARIYQAYVKPKAVRTHLKRLRRTAQLLGAVRDLDVAIAKLENYQRKTKKKSAGDLQATLDKWLGKRAGAHHALVAWLDSEAYAELVVDFLHFCRTPGAGIADMGPEAGEEVAPFQVRHVAPAMLLSNFARVRAFEVWFDRPQAVPVETLHLLRIECKYLRYNLEFLANLLGPESGTILTLLRKLQEDLGDLNDAVVSRQLLANGQNRNDEKTMARYELSQAKIIARLRSQTCEDFLRFVGAENRSRLLAAVAMI